MKVKVYVEGGGNRALDADCRAAFAKLFQKAGLTNRRPAVKPCGGRHAAYSDFCTALRSADSDDFPILLVDSESPVFSGPWQHVKSRDEDNWDCPPGASDEHLHLMVQIMETWFLADRQALATYFDGGFHENRLPSTANLEDCPKERVLRSLHDASRDTRKGGYDKGRHSFQILAVIDPEKIENCSAHGKRFFDTLREKAS